MITILKKKSNQLIFFLFLTFNFFAQGIGQPITDDLKQVLSLAFEKELENKDSIVLRYNFNAIFIKEALNKNKIKVWDERKLFQKRYLNFYSIENIELNASFAKVTYILRNKNLIFNFLFYKEENNWYIINKKTKWQGRIKGNDFLILSIKEVLKNKH